MSAGNEKRSRKWLRWSLLLAAGAVLAWPMFGCPNCAANDSQPVSESPQGCRSNRRCNCQHAIGAPCSCPCCQAEARNPGDAAPAACSCYTEPARRSDDAMAGTPSCPSDSQAHLRRTFLPLPRILATAAALTKVGDCAWKLSPPDPPPRLVLLDSQNN